METDPFLPRGSLSNQVQPDEACDQQLSPPCGYRPDIDGLRALAIVSVLVFQAYPSLLPGGFIGIDIFFVISGFLVSNVLIKQHEECNFTYASFYERRVRRIAPTLIIGALLKHTAATLLTTNVQVLSLERAYFKYGSNPVLHLWSLGVGGLYYIFWPFFYVFVMKQPYKRAVQLQIAFFALSFVINVIASVGNHDNKTVLYLPLGRFWQLSMGGLLSYVMTAQATASLPPLTDSSRFGGRMSAAGLCLVVTGFSFIDAQSALPGVWALLPTVGATLLIAAGPQAPFNHYVLSNDVLVSIGKISYGVYLWYWPLLIISNRQYPPTLSRPFTMEPWCMLQVSVALSIITYELVEQPLRWGKPKWITPALVLCVLELVALAATLRML
ncbi:hypothetical protein SPRG_16647 [Saprolegnia parasitica CBS 223.65]|uniref:Acyltransferase 3 domain-containing protein n=1 Tax=Saprolegnia parasitica (strain CBS 223.65) TaxID=695850 RepID=A0A067BMG1_SAPPC|nr:hypothetical protein SPRG_16647 [Saprolegnia parasitica CBS 223.65]KDO17930.1 hypothetical protein SPRG_16647 [Saprolegnia parasitica CBS 223.65]|eukprot:XP_012211361.1 hypothetical protein SPRG_16647 [Saprolegnia parasitica CBS 223.65]